MMTFFWQRQLLPKLRKYGVQQLQLLTLSLQSDDQALIMNPYFRACEKNGGGTMVDECITLFYKNCSVYIIPTLTAKTYFSFLLINSSFVLILPT